MNIKMINILFLSCFLILSCDPETSENDPDEIDGDLIPSSIGNYWVYEDSLFVDGAFTELSMDTLIIIDTLRAHGKKWWELVGHQNLPFIYQYYAIENDSVYSIQGGWSTILSLDYIYPSDTLTVLETIVEGDLGLSRNVIKYDGSITTNAGTFINCGKYYGEWTGTFYVEEYINPGVGFIKSIFMENFSGNAENKHIRNLHSYHVDE